MLRVSDRGSTKIRGRLTRSYFTLVGVANRLRKDAHDKPLSHRVRKRLPRFWHGRRTEPACLPLFPRALFDRLSFPFFIGKAAAFQIKHTAAPAAASFLWARLPPRSRADDSRPMQDRVFRFPLFLFGARRNRLKERSAKIFVLQRRQNWHTAGNARETARTDP